MAEMPEHNDPDCTGNWNFWKHFGDRPPDAVCDRCRARHPARTLEEVQMYIRENLRGLELRLATSAYEPG